MVDELNVKDMSAVFSAQYYANYVSHIGMYQLRDRLSEIVQSINEGNHAPSKTKGIIFELGPGDAEFEVVKVGKSEYLVRKDCLERVSTGVSI